MRSCAAERVDVGGDAADDVDAPPVTPLGTAAAAAAPYAEVLARRRRRCSLDDEQL